MSNLYKTSSFQNSHLWLNIDFSLMESTLLYWQFPRNTCCLTATSASEYSAFCWLYPIGSVWDRLSLSCFSHFLLPCIAAKIKFISFSLLNTQKSSTQLYNTHYIFCLTCSSKSTKLIPSRMCPIPAIPEIAALMPAGMAVPKT